MLFYIVDLYSGDVAYTEDPEKARELSAIEDYFVVDATNKLWLHANGDQKEIRKI